MNEQEIKLELERRKIVGEQVLSELSIHLHRLSPKVQAIAIEEMGWSFRDVQRPEERADVVGAYSDSFFANVFPKPPVRKSVARDGAATAVLLSEADGKAMTMIRSNVGHMKDEQLDRLKVRIQALLAGMPKKTDTSSPEDIKTLVYRTEATVTLTAVEEQLTRNAEQTADSN